MDRSTWELLMHYRSLFPVFLIIFATLGSPLVAQDDQLSSEVAAAMQAGLDEWNAGDIDALVSGNPTGSPAGGFGYRSMAPRGIQDPVAGQLRSALTQFFDSVEYYRATVEEVHAREYENVVVAWGFFTEDFKHHGRNSELYRIRFSTTLLRDDAGQLRTIMSHRDIQPFDERGGYLPRPR
jgi:hypothetical protein